MINSQSYASLLQNNNSPNKNPLVFSSLWPPLLHTFELIKQSYKHKCIHASAVVKYTIIMWSYVIS